MKTMMKSLCLLMAFAMMACNGTAQKEKKNVIGTDFQEITFDEALKQAKKEGKQVFIDCYIQTCGPCKLMAKNVFPQKEVGDFLNPKFVCMKMDMGVGEGKTLARKYQVGIYPTFLVINPDGTMVCNVMGGTQDKMEFIKIMEDALAKAAKK